MEMLPLCWMFFTFFRSLGGSFCCRSRHQGTEGAAKGPKEGEEHPTQWQHLHGRHHRCRPRHGAALHGQGVLWDYEGGARHCPVRRLHRGRDGPPRRHRRHQ